ncbi:MAG: Crp/Fnr family transcriptional regulator [Hahellaceae bacterium]|nr:Crp/Fnr family transcriptional regulator [Hahellaceae bacterium]MCP5168230.1 Crp/Fnr family transcriptional regulator [Hahellaceae bacterium]
MNRQQVEQAFLTYFSQSYGLFKVGNFAELGIDAELKHYPKGARLIQQGAPAPKLFFLANGLARYVSLSPDGKEFTQSFARSPGMAGSTRAMIRQTPALFNIEVLEDCLCLEFHWQSFFDRMKQIPGFLETYAHMMEALFIAKEERENAFVQLSAEQRYLNFIDQHPALVDKIPLQYVASYIGITPVALSRIRKRLR